MPRTKPQHEPTPALRKTVQLHATVGTKQEVIAQILGITEKTLRKHYRAELDLAEAQANATIGGALFNKAKAGNTAAMIFWMKTRGGWRETNRQEITGPDGGPIQTEDVSRDADEFASRILRLAAGIGQNGPSGEAEG